MKPSDLKSGMRVTLRVKEGNNEDEVYYIVRDMVVGLHLKDKASLFNPYDSRVVAHINGYTDEFNHKETPLLDIMKIYDIDDTLLFERDTDWTKVEIGEDVEYLKDRWGLSPLPNIAKKLGRTENAVARKLWEKGIKARPIQGGQIIMAGFIAKQPNGLYCRFSSIVDTVTHWNMTKEDYVKVIMERGYNKEYAKKEAEEVINDYLRPFRRVLESFRPINDTVEEFTQWVKSVGYKEDDLDDWIKTWNEWFDDEDEEEDE